MRFSRLRTQAPPCSLSMLPAVPSRHSQSSIPYRASGRLRSHARLVATHHHGSARTKGPEKCVALRSCSSWESPERLDISQPAADMVSVHHGTLACMKVAPTIPVDKQMTLRRQGPGYTYRIVLGNRASCLSDENPARTFWERRVHGQKGGSRPLRSGTVCAGNPRSFSEQQGGARPSAFRGLCPGYRNTVSCGRRRHSGPRRDERWLRPGGSWKTRVC